MSIETIALSEVAKHNKEGDLWLVIHGKVYDISTFTDEHPGGMEVLLDVGGTDGSKEFDSIGHSDGAKEMLGKYLIGELSEEDKKVNKKDDTKSVSGSKESTVIVPVIMFIVAVVVYFVMKH